MLNQNYSSFGWSKRTGACLGAIALGVTALLLPSCTTETAEKTTVTTEDVAEVGGDRTQLIGKEVTVRNLPERAVGKSAFVMEAQDGQPILVVNATGTPFELPGREIPVQATGRVESLIIADIEREYGLDLENELYTDYERQPTIIAKSLALAPNPRNLYEAPISDFVNKPIAVEGELRKLDYTPNAFALFEEGWANDVGVLVVGVERNLKAQGSPLEEGGNVTVTGVARPFSAELVREAGLGWNDEQIREFEARYTNRPVIVADGVYPSAVPPVPGS